MGSQSYNSSKFSPFRASNSPYPHAQNSESQHWQLHRASESSSRSRRSTTINSRRSNSTSSSYSNTNETMPASTGESDQSRHSYATGRFQGKGVFNPGSNAQFNYVIQKFKHRKDPEEEKVEELPKLTAKNLKRLSQ